jgi:hypothetical protein
MKLIRWQGWLMPEREKDYLSLYKGILFERAEMVVENEIYY